MDRIPSQMEICAVPLHAVTSEQTDQIVALCSAVFRLDYAFYMNLDLPRVYTSWPTRAIACPPPAMADAGVCEWAPARGPMPRTSRGGHACPISAGRGTARP